MTTDQNEEQQPARTMMRRSSLRFNPDAVVEPDDPVGGPVLKPSFSRRESLKSASRSGSSRFLSRSESVAQRDDDLLAIDNDRHLGRRGSSLRGGGGGGDERPMSAREAAASQEAAEAEAAAAAAAEAAAAAAAAAKEAEEAEHGFVKGADVNEKKEDDEGGAAAEDEDEKEPTAGMFSLMDLLEQTDKQMGWKGSRYMDEEDEDYEEDEDEEEEDEYSGCESSCSICKVKHREAPLAPCGHAYCKMCSKELHVSRSNCPVCNDFIQEILDVF